MNQFPLRIPLAAGNFAAFEELPCRCFHGQADGIWLQFHIDREDSDGMPSMLVSALQDGYGNAVNTQCSSDSDWVRMRSRHGELVSNSCICGRVSCLIEYTS